MKYKLDLHCHSIASDGSLTMLQLAMLAKKVGLDGLVLTDHCRPNNANQSNVVVLETLLAKADNYGIQLPVPIIIGSEIRTPYGEFLLFGKKACKQWDYYKDQLDMISKKFGVEQYWDMFSKFVLHKLCCSRGKMFLNVQVNSPLAYALAICHPREIDLSWCKYMPKFFWHIVHGFEIQNANEHYDELKPEVINFFKEHIPKYKALRNSDCHSDELGMVFNEMELKEVSENQLIHWFRS